jgi:MFS family permease
LGRAGLLGAIPLLAATGQLTMGYLYVAALLAGALTVVADTALLVLLPALVRREVVLYLVRDLGWSAVQLGVAVTTLGVASVVGALIAPAYSRRFGTGRAYLIGQSVAACAGFALALAWWPFVFAGQAMAGLGLSLYGVPQRALRQLRMPDHLLGRTTAAWRTLVIGGQTVGALVGGLLGTVLDLRAALVISSLGMLAGVALAYFSPVRSTR